MLLLLRERCGSSCFPATVGRDCGADELAQVVIPGSANIVVGVVILQQRR